MKVELNIDGSQLGETVVELFKNLGEDQRKEIARSVLDSWLREPYDVERKAYEAQIFREFRARGRDGYTNYADMSDDKLRSEYRVQEELKKFVSSRETMVKEITQAAIAHFKEQITEKIKTDDNLTKLWNATSEVLKADFPNIARDAMIAFFCTNMTTMAAGVQQAMWSSQNAEQLMGQVRNRLNQM